jgi:hypothetical protein
LASQTPMASDSVPKITSTTRKISRMARLRFRLARPQTPSSRTRRCSCVHQRSDVLNRSARPRAHGDRDRWLQDSHRMATKGGWSTGRTRLSRIRQVGSGPGIRTLNLAVNRWLHPVQKSPFEYRDHRGVPPNAVVCYRRCCMAGVS